MKKIFWAVFLLGVYIWIVSSGREDWVLDQSKNVYNAVSEWFSDADIDYQVQEKPVSVKKKRPRRWD